MAEVKITQAYRPSTRPLIARSIWAGVRGGSTAMVGTSVGDRAVRAQPLAHRPGLLLGPRHQHLPPVQRAGLPPAQLLSPGQPLPEGQHHSAAEPERRRHKTVHSGGGGVLGVTGAVPGHRHRVSPSTPAASSPSRTSARSPASTASATCPRVARLASARSPARSRHPHPPWCAYRPAECRRTWLRRRPGRSPAPPRTAPRPGRPPGPRQHRRPTERVARDQVDRVPPGLRRLHQHLGHLARHPLRGGELRVRPSVGPSRGQQRLRQAPVVDDLVSRRQRVNSAPRQQAGIAGATPDERDPAGGITYESSSLLLCSPVDRVGSAPPGPRAAMIVVLRPPAGRRPAPHRDAEPRRSIPVRCRVPR